MEILESKSKRKIEDDDFVVKNRKKSVPTVDIMGPITSTAERKSCLLRTSKDWSS